MSRRARSLSFLLGALLAAGAAAAIADGYGSRAARGYGPLRPVVVVAAELAADRPIGARELTSALEVRRVPERFVPEGALAAPERALGLAPRADLTPGSYLLATELVPPSRGGEGRRRIAPGRSPVEIAVSGAGALLAAGAPPVGATVDVVVTSEPSGSSGRGRTYVAASGVRLLALRRGPGSAGAGGTAAATLALTRAQALRLIAAESFARRITVLPRG